jgi:hypothetical protein
MIQNKWLKRLTLLAAVLTILLLTAGLVGAGPLATTLDRWVTAGGGGTISSGTIAIDGTIGQPVAGLSASGNSQLCAGFHCNPDTELSLSHHLYLPNVVRTSP